MGSLEGLEEQQINAWLFTKGMKKINRLNHRFADATQMASLIKSIYPSMVDLYNYSACDRLSLKINNWTTLNKKVLMKLRLEKSQEQLIEYAKGQPGAINGLLWEIMTLERKKYLRGAPAEKQSPAPPTSTPTKSQRPTPPSSAKCNSKGMQCQCENIIRQISNHMAEEPQTEEELFWDTVE